MVYQETGPDIGSEEELIHWVAEALQLTEAWVARRREFLGLGDDEAERLAQVGKGLEALHDRLSRRLIRHLRGYPELSAFLEDPATAERVRDEHRRYFGDLLGGRYDWAYAQRRVKLGLIHHRVGLNPRWYLGTYCLYLCDLVPELWNTMAKEPESVRWERILTLMKIVFLDLEWVLEAYGVADRRESRARLDLIERVVCSMPMGVLVVDKDLRVNAANRAVDRLFGFRHGALVGRELKAIVGDTDIIEQVHEAFETGELKTGLDLEGNGGQGRFKVTLSLMRPQAENGVQQMHMLVIFEDVTEVTWLRTARARSDALLRTVMDGLGEGVFTLDASGRIIDVNAGAESLTGYSADTLHHKQIETLIPQWAAGRGRASVPWPGAAPRYDREAFMCMANGVNADVHISEIEVELEGEPCSVAVVRDISERKYEQRRMSILSSALEQSADSVVITDRDGVIQYVNTGFEKMTGYGREEVTGGRPNMIKSGVHEPDFYARMWAQILSGGVYRDIVVNRRKSGEIYYEEKTITPLRDPQGEITHFISTGKDITDRVQAEERLNFLAHHDPLTRLPNRTLFSDRLTQSLARTRRHGVQGALLFLDVDGFKRINDTLGHQVGDQLLENLAERLRSNLRESDTIARLGGDEFAVIIDDFEDEREVVFMANKLLDIFARPMRVESRELTVTCSIGICLYPADGNTLDHLLKCADVAMYRAKEAGRNCYQFYHAEFDGWTVERLELEGELRHSLDRCELELHYQPQVDIVAGEVVGFEALLRWRHPTLGMLSPGEFLPLLEESGMSLPVGRWVLAEACRTLGQLSAGGFDGLTMAVNLSGRQFTDEGLHDCVHDVLAETGVPASALELEITEHTILSSLETVEDVLQDLAEQGVRFAIDDFGTGHSSLSRLKRFPVHTLKIDRSFVNDITCDADDAAITEAITSMAHTLGLEVVAEGVETQEQLTFLRARGCRLLQGYLFSQPIPADALIPYLARQEWRAHL